MPEQTKNKEAPSSEGQPSVEATVKAPAKVKKSPCEIERATEPCTLVIFGASGDLTERKLIPSLYRLYINGLLPAAFLIVGTGRKALGDGGFRDKMGKALLPHASPGREREEMKNFLSNLHYEQLDYTDLEAYKKLSDSLTALEDKDMPGGNRIYYLSTPPSVYTIITENLGLSRLSAENGGWRRIVIEKPFGHDLQSARALNTHIRHHFMESQIFRIDHYLGKETVQDILMFRFANAIFEPIWDRRYIDHVQITAAESIGIENRAGYYDKSGVIRDMFQNHVLQLVSLTAMEPPADFEADAVRDEKVKVLKSIRSLPLNAMSDCIALGQYGPGRIGNKSVVSYRDEEGIEAGSQTATYAAVKLYIDNWRWKGVPFYLRSGKRLAKRKTEIAVQFRHVPHFMFKDVMEEEITPNTLVFTIQPDEGIKLTLQTKMPGTKVCLREVVMDFKYKDFYSGASVDAYERVLIDCLEGDHTLFVREDGVDCAWKLLTPLLEAIESDPASAPFDVYDSGSEGPGIADKLIVRDGRKWRGL